MDKYYTYILKLCDNSYYVGSTKNLKERLNRHSNGYVRSTKHGRPVKLMYQEFFGSLGEARKRESQLKSWKSRKALERLFKNAPIV